jgi:hypothetical protein
MRIGERIDRFLSRLEWRWSLRQFALGAYVIASTALPAWAVSAMETFQQYAPLSWVLAGFLGLTFAVVSFALFAWANGRWVRSSYNKQLLARSGYVDPMAKTFENKRIFLSEFCLPSEPHIEGKAFINCDIVGPANILVRSNNQIEDHHLPICDAILTRTDRTPNNGIYIDNCTFRGCSFKRITIIVPQEAYPNFSHLNWLHWLNIDDEQPDIPGLTENSSQANPRGQIASQSPPNTEAETPP